MLVKLVTAVLRNARFDLARRSKAHVVLVKLVTA